MPASHLWRPPGGTGRQRRVVARGGAVGDDAGPGGRPAADPDRRKRPLFRRADRRPGRNSGPGPGRPCRSPPSAGRTGSRRPARQPAGGRSGNRGPAATGRQPAHRPRLGGVARHRLGLGRLAEPAAATPRHGGSPPSCSIRRATRFGPPSPRRLEAMLRQGALDEVRAIAGVEARPDACQRCAHTACRSSRPICAGRSRCRRPVAVPNW